MKTKFNGILTLLLAFTVHFAFAQKTVTGTVSDDTGALPGVNVVIQGTNTGTETDFDGNYSIQANTGDILVFSYIGMDDVMKTVGSSNTIDVTMAGGLMLDEVVVTALGVKRAKKSLGYSTQQVKGDDVSNAPVDNFANALSGEIAGLDIKSSGTMGGSSNVIIRGFNSISGNNQALIIIDGTPVLNNITNGNNQATGRGGYDYGNAAMDINPDDIASINVLKGAASTALYGSRGSNGVILITTKKGSKSNGLGIDVSSSVSLGQVDTSTLPVYQDKYGAGYGPFYDDPYFLVYDLDGDGTDDQVVPFTEDASYGAAFDPSLMVFQWNSIYPELGDTYHKKTPWVAAKNTPNSLWQNGLTTNNSISFGKSSEDHNFRVGYTNSIQNGVLPNSSIDKNTVSLSGMQKLKSKTTVSSSFAYSKINGKGRPGTGYDDRNPMQAFRQWFQTNVDVQEQKDAFFSSGINATWNPNSDTNRTPIYTDNVYWTLYKNYETDTRNRYTGNFAVNQEVTEWMDVMGKFSFDGYTESREERMDVGSHGVPNYTLLNRDVSEMNFDLLSNYKYNFTDDLAFTGLLGYNQRIEHYHYFGQTTNGGLNQAGLFTFSNSKNPITSDNIAKVDQTKKVEGIFGGAGLGFKDTYFIDATLRRDRSSALPIANNAYNYYSVSSSMIFSNLFEADWLDYGKLRANYATVGNDTDPYQVFTTYGVNAGFGGHASASNASTFNNEELKAETTTDFEVGIETQLLKNRFGFDLSYYNRKTIDLITPINVSLASGASRLWLNGADMETKGFEAIVNLTPVKTDKFKWNMKFNYGSNQSEVTRLAEGIDFIQLGSVQGGITLGAALGEAFGVIRGKDFVYDNDGNKVIKSNGYYYKTPNSNNVIGDINPDWTGGLKNSLTYKNISLGFLIDVQKGGDVFSLDTWYGYGTGLYDFTAEDNDLGNPVRDDVTDDATSGGVVLDGVQGTVVFEDDGSYTVTETSNNDVRAYAGWYANPWGWARAPQKMHVYDASFVKLREASLTYNFNKKVTDKLKLQKMSLSFVGRNLWIIYKNTPYADPEAGLSAGNIQGYQSGVYPSVKEFSAKLNIKL